MNKPASALLGVTGIVLGGLGLLGALRLRSEVAALKTDQEKTQAALSQLKSSVDGLAQKRDRETSPRGIASSSSEVGFTTKENPSPSVKPPTGAYPAAPGEGVEDFPGLHKRVLDGTATDEEKEKFWKIVREKPGLLDDVLKQLEKAAADDPGNKEAHRRLADAYLAKLMSVPDGMQKGIWSNKMIAEEKKILELDPGDWDARFSVAVNYSFWPEQFNKRPDAIKEFETLMRLQESRPPDAKYAQTYLQLRQLYLKEGRVDDSRTVLEQGLRLYPNDAELIKARDGVK